MEIKKKKFKLVATLLSMGVLCSFITPSLTSVYASEITPEKVVVEKEVKNINVPTFKEFQEKVGLDLVTITPEKIRSYAEEVGAIQNSNETIITDSQMIAILKKMGVAINEIPGARKNGVTKIVSKGSGSWDVYLSGTFIQNYYFALEAAAVVIAAMIPGVGLPLAFTICGLAASFVGMNTKHGCIVKVRNWKATSVVQQ